MPWWLGATLSIALKWKIFKFWGNFSPTASSATISLKLAPTLCQTNIWRRKSYVTLDTWRVTCDMWHITCDIWHLVRDIVLKIYSQWMTDWVTQSVNDISVQLMETVQNVIRCTSIQEAMASLFTTCALTWNNIFWRSLIVYITKNNCCLNNVKV